jgi:hypothetical protein
MKTLKTLPTNSNYGPAVAFERTDDGCRVEVLLNIAGKFGAVTPHGEMWEATEEKLLAKLAFVFGKAERAGMRLVP